MEYDFMQEFYAYGRVSSNGQNEARQVKEFTRLGILKHNIFIEKASGKTFNRAKYLKLLDVIKTGDILYICSIDRLGRDYDGILLEWYKLTKELKVVMKVLDAPILNTDTKPKTVMEKYLQDITLLTLAFQAEQEWHNIKERQKAGIIIAKEKGTVLGRPKAVRSDKELHVVEAWQNGVINAHEAMQKLNLKKSAFYKLANDIKQL